MDKRLEEGRQPVDADLVLARERGHMDHVVLAISDEDGVNEHRLQRYTVSNSIGQSQHSAYKLTFVSWRSACQDRARGWKYPPCNWLPMSPEMLTLVAAVLAYPDMVRETCDARSSKVETEGVGPGRRGALGSRRLSS